MELRPWHHLAAPAERRRPAHPVVHASHADARAYALWAGLDLPTEAEWEYAVRGSAGASRYQWGDDLTPGGRIMADTWHGEFPAPGAFLQGTELPETYTERLALNHKPSAQVQSQVLIAGGLGPLPTERGARDYADFYAYLHTNVDQHLGALLDTLDARPEVRDRTVIFRISDHGEMGMSHDGLRQKAFNAYEETLSVLPIVRNPVMFPAPVTTSALASLVDLLPTMAGLAEIPDPGEFTFRGASLVPVIERAVTSPNEPSADVQDTVMFTFDDENAAAADGQDIVKEPNHIRAVRDHRDKYAVYSDPAGVAPPPAELYDLHEDPNELRNLANPLAPLQFRPDLVETMHAKLEEKMAATRTTPMPPPEPPPAGSIG